MLRIDLHTHTLNSLCGNNTALEMMRAARERDLEVLALTDHGPAAHSTIRGTFFDDERFPIHYGALTLLKGLELAIMSVDGRTDLPANLADKLHIVLAGLHQLDAPCVKPSGIETHTEAVINTIRRRPAIDVLTHPDIRWYPLDFEPVAKAAAENGVALEINNANFKLGRTDYDKAREMIAAGRRHGTLFTIDSDAHTYDEVGRDNLARQWLREIDAPALDIINDWPAERALEHFAARRRARRAEAEAQPAD